MPIYEYECIICKTRFEELVKLSDKEKPVPCERCDGETRRVPSVSANNAANWAGWRKK